MFFRHYKEKGGRTGEGTRVIVVRVTLYLFPKKEEILRGRLGIPVKRPRHDFRVMETWLVNKVDHVMNPIHVWRIQLKNPSSNWLPILEQKVN
jgi:hypothetical protein